MWISPARGEAGYTDDLWRIQAKNCLRIHLGALEVKNHLSSDLPIQTYEQRVDDAFGSWWASRWDEDGPWTTSDDRERGYTIAAEAFAAGFEAGRSASGYVKVPEEYFASVKRAKPQ